MERASSGLAVVMSGGGARAAYQVGVLQEIVREFPDLEIEILTGVSAGAINVAWLASQPGDLGSRVDGLSELWSNLETENVIRTETFGLLWRALRWGLRLMSGGRIPTRRLHGMVDTQPLREFLGHVLKTDGETLPGIARNLASGSLRAVAMTGTSYTTGQTITFVEGRNSAAGEISDWERPMRRSKQCRISVEHVMASAALPMLFPAVRLEEGWFGDGGIRLHSPLSPAVHLGARKILAISTRFGRSRAEADIPEISGYPPPAQVAGLILNAIFLDMLDVDALRLERINSLVRELPLEKRHGLRLVDLQVWRPSRDLGHFANEFEARMPRGLRFLARGTGTRETRSNDFLSLIMFQPDYTSGLIELGRADAAANMDAIRAFITKPTSAAEGAPAQETSEAQS